MNKTLSDSTFIDELCEEIISLKRSKGILRIESRHDDTDLQISNLKKAIREIQRR